MKRNVSLYFVRFLQGNMPFCGTECIEKNRFRSSSKELNCCEMGMKFRSMNIWARCKRSVFHVELQPIERWHNYCMQAATTIRYFNQLDDGFVVLFRIRK